MYAAKGATHCRNTVEGGSMERTAKRTVRIVVFAAMAALLATTLTGCGAKAHQVVADEGVCLSCHNDSFAVDKSPTAKWKSVDTVYSTTGQVAVTVNGVGSFYVCRPMATTLGEKAIPVAILARGPISVTEGEPYALTLDPGSWLLVIQKEGKVASQLIVVGDSPAGKTVDAVTLKL